MIKENELTELKSALKNSPLYAMSLGSKELFHSNFWAWLIEHNSKYVNVFFKGLSEKNIKVLREKGNRDLTICIENPDEGEVGVYIIENKIKSIPTKDQLREYMSDMKYLKDETFNSKKYKKFTFEGGLLTGLLDTPPEWIGKGDLENWKFLSYDAIKTGIRDIADKNETVKNKTDEYNKTIIEHYCDDIENLCSLVDDVLSKAKENLRWDFKEAKELEEIRFDDAYKKLKASMIGVKLGENLGEKLKNCGGNHEFKFEIIPDLSNKEANLSFKFIYTKNDKDDDDNGKKSSKKICAFGIQIQGKTFNRFAEMDKDVDCDELFKEFKNIGWFSDYEKGSPTIHFQLKNNIIGEYSTTMSPRVKIGKYNKYGSNFIRQYFTIKGYTLDDLSKQLKKHLEYALSILGKAQGIFDKLQK